jgi:hypothetical protein
MLKSKGNIPQPNLFSEINKNISILYNEEILLNLTKNSISHFNNSEFVNLESFIQLSNLLKSQIKKNKNLNIDPIYSLTYSYILVMKNTVQNFTIISKILFAFAGLYSELSLIEKSCFVILNKFEIDHVINTENFNRNNNSTSLIEREFMHNYKTLSHFKDPQHFKNIVISFFQNLEVTKIINKEINMNFFILLLNNLLCINNDNFSFYINLSYEFLDKNKNEIFQNISQVHFNNLVKILSRMNEVLLKNNENLSLFTQNLIVSNKVKILLYELLFSSKFANLEITYTFISNHINEYLILQKTKNFKNLLLEKHNFLKESLIDDFFTFICNRLESESDENRLSNYAYLIGKIYSFYFNFGSISQTVEERSVFYSNKILQIYKKTKLVINELIIIKVNLFKDFMVVSKNKINEVKITDQILSHIEEITVLFRNIKLNSESDNEFFISIIKFLKRCGDNLMIVLVNNLSSYYTLWNITEKLEKLFEIFILDKKDILTKKNEFLEFHKFYSLLKIFNFSATDKDLKSFYKIISNFLGEKNSLNNIQTQHDEILVKISLLMTYYSKSSEFEKMIHLTLIISKYNYEVFTYSLTILFSNLKKNKNFQISDKNVYFFLEKILELLKHFETQSLNNFKKDNKLFDITKFFRHLEKNILYIFKIIISNLISHLRSNNLDEFSNQCNKFFNYFKITSDVLEQIKNFTKVEELNTSFLIMLIFLDKIFNTNEPKSEITFIKNCLDSNLFKDIISNKKYVELIETFSLQFLFEKFNNQSEIKYPKLDKINLTEINKIFLNLIFQHKQEDKLDGKFNYMNLVHNLSKIYKNFQTYDVINTVDKMKEYLTKLNHNKKSSEYKIDYVLQTENENIITNSTNLLHNDKYKTCYIDNTESSLKLINDILIKDKLYEQDYISVK